MNNRSTSETGNHTNADPVDEVTVRFMPHSFIKQHFENQYKENSLVHRLYRKGGRGFSIIEENLVYICAEHYDSQLLAHEILHTRAGGAQAHPKWWQFWRWLGIMSASGIFRWFVNVPKSWFHMFNHFRR